MDIVEHGSMGSLTPGTALRDLVTIKLESCHSTWYFQPVRMRFRRQLKGIGLAGVCTDWRPYYGVRFDDEFDRFTVFLNRDGTRLLSSWSHPTSSETCDKCDAESPIRQPQPPLGRREPRCGVPLPPASPDR